MSIQVLEVGPKSSVYVDESMAGRSVLVSPARLKRSKSEGLSEWSLVCLSSSKSVRADLSFSEQIPVAHPATRVTRPFM